jgi:hypothetical protein
MPLFIDSLPLYSSDGNRRWSVSLPVIVTPPGAPAPPADATPQRWIFDTGFTGDAYCWQSDLLDAGVDPTAEPLRPRTIKQIAGPRYQFPACGADLWLVSNIPFLRDRPYRLELNHRGITYNPTNAPRPADAIPPLIGIKLFRRACLRIFLDAFRDTVSIWTPGPWYNSLAVAARRLFSGYARLPMPW